MDWIEHYGEEKSVGAFVIDSKGRFLLLCRADNVKPATFAWPLVLSIILVSMCTVVVLPAPFGPRNLNISPFLTLKDMPLTAVNAPYFLASFDT